MIVGITSLLNFNKVLAVLCHWANTRVGTLYCFPIGGQLDYVNAVLKIGLNQLLLHASWTLSDPLALG